MSNSRWITILANGDYITLRISELEDFIYGSVGCPKNAWGKQVIDDINVALTKLKVTPRYYKALAEWLPQEIRDQGFRMVYQQEFIKN